MRAVRTYGPGDLRVEDVPEPTIAEPTDAIVKVTASAVCGSDLHLYHGKIPGIEPGMVCGHEFAGEVVEVGAGVLDIAAGDRCVAAMFSACGRCPACLRMEHRRCPRFAMFGYGVAQPGDVVAVVGAGPLGQLIVMCAPLFGCSTVVAIDVVPDRLKEAEALGAVPVDATAGDPFDAVYDLTNNHGADLVIEAAGNAAALRTALSVVRIAGRVVLVGVLVDEPFPISAGETFLRGLSITGLVGEPLRYRADLLRLIEARRLDPARIVSHTVPLTEAVDAYRMFGAREATKVVLQP